MTVNGQVVAIPKKNISKGLEINEDEKVWRIVRARTIDGEKVILDKDYVVQKFVENLTEDICKNSLYEYVENVLGLKIAYAKKEISVNGASTSFIILN